MHLLRVGFWWLGVITRVITLVGMGWVWCYRDEIVVVEHPTGWAAPSTGLVLLGVGAAVVVLALSEALWRGPTGQIRWWNRIVGWTTALATAAGVATAWGVVCGRVVLRVGAWQVAGTTHLRDLAEAVNQLGGDATRASSWELLNRSAEEVAAATAPASITVPSPPPGWLRVAVRFVMDHPWEVAGAVALAAAALVWWSGFGPPGTPPGTPPDSPPGTPPRGPFKFSLDDSPPPPALSADITRQLNSMADFQQQTGVGVTYGNPLGRSFGTVTDIVNPATVGAMAATATTTLAGGPIRSTYRAGTLRTTISTLR